jgi:hypothetical protein
MQKSGFSNIITKPYLMEECKKRKIPWVEEQNFVLDRLPILFKYYILSPPRNSKSGVIAESLSLRGLLTTIQFVCVGFIGMGSI